jgi:5-formyltetrahydrofolate cyclo-ligase
MNGTKDSIRREMRARRRALSPAMRGAAERALCVQLADFPPYAAAAAVLAYAATENEFPTGALIARALADGKQVFLPRVRGGSMRFARLEPARGLRPGTFGIPEPTGRVLRPDADGPTVGFVPLLAWDARGTRLGRGGGFYDRALAALTGRVCPVGLGYAFQRRVALPRDAWDIPLHYVLTEEGTVRCCSWGGHPSSRKEDTTCDDVRLDCGDRNRGRLGPGGLARPAAATAL